MSYLELQGLQIVNIIKTFSVTKNVYFCYEIFLLICIIFST